MSCGACGMLRNILLVLSLAGCPGSGVPSSDGPGNGTSTRIRGRVVDFESCLTAAGCSGIAGVRVTLRGNSRLTSAKTPPDGSFVLSGLPPGVRVHLLVRDTKSPKRYVSSLQAAGISTATGDQFGLEIYAIKRLGGLYAAIEKELSISGDTRGIYLGQVLTRESGTFKAYQGASASAVPSAKVRYIRTNPRLEPGKKALYSASRHSTGPFGQFIAVSSAAAGHDHAIVVTAVGTQFEPRVAPLGSGYIAIGLHRALQSAKSDAGTTRSDAGADGATGKGG